MKNDGNRGISVYRRKQLLVKCERDILGTPSVYTTNVGLCFFLVGKCTQNYINLGFSGGKTYAEEVFTLAQITYKTSIHKLKCG